MRDASIWWTHCETHLFLLLRTQHCREKQEVRLKETEQSFGTLVTDGKPTCPLAAAAIGIVSFTSQQVLVRMWGLIMMNKHNLQAFARESLLWVPSSDFSLIEPWRDDCPGTPQWSSSRTGTCRAEAISACRWRIHCSCVNIKSYFGGGSFAPSFPEKADLSEVFFASLPPHRNPPSSGRDTKSDPVRARAKDVWDKAGQQTLRYIYYLLPGVVNLFAVSLFLFFCFVW